MIALCSALGAVLFLFLVWFFLVAPGVRKKAETEPFRRAFAHRGLWGGDVPENSLPAFRRAAEAGFAIELDVHLSADGTVYVFHDDDLSRMCGREGRIETLTDAEISALTLGDTAERIPTFAEVLQTVAGRVPLLVELKGESTDTSVCPPTAALLDAYEGKWCVESFNPFLLRWFRKHRKNAVRGLLVTDLIKDKRSGSKLVNFALSAELFNFLCRPAFLAWNRVYPGGAAKRTAFFLGAASFVYTVRDEEEYRTLIAAGASPIFEGFTPAD